MFAGYSEKRLLSRIPGDSREFTSGRYLDLSALDPVIILLVQMDLDDFDLALRASAKHKPHLSWREVYISNAIFELPDMSHLLPVFRCTHTDRPTLRVFVSFFPDHHSTVKGARSQHVSKNGVSPLDLPNWGGMGSKFLTEYPAIFGVIVPHFNCLVGAAGGEPVAMEVKRNTVDELFVLGLEKPRCFLAHHPSPTMLYNFFKSIHHHPSGQVCGEA